MNDPNNNEDMRTELIRRIWRMVGERDEVIDKRDALRRIVEQPSIEFTERAHAGMVRLEEVMGLAIKDVDGLIVEALELLAGIGDEAEGDD